MWFGVVMGHPRSSCGVVYVILCEAFLIHHQFMTERGTDRRTTTVNTGKKLPVSLMGMGTFRGIQEHAWQSITQTYIALCWH